MTIKYVGVIYNGDTSQAHINLDHAKDIGSALSDFEVTYYNVTELSDVKKMIADKESGKLDIVINNSAGRKGGDGTVEGLLEILDLPYVGSDVLATAVAFDKKSTKFVVADHGVPIIRGYNFSREQFDTQRDWVLKQIEDGLKYPVVVKASQGSDSIGVSLVRKSEKLLPALERAFKEDSNVIVEDFIKRSAEITCMVIGQGETAYALKPVERVYEGDILYSYEITDRTYRTPSQIDQSILDAIEVYSIIAHNALNCSDYSRSDFLVGQKGNIYFLELNAHAGLGSTGPTAYAAKTTKNWEHKDLIQELLSIAAKRYASK
jgi:D-alanine-D-alanine ligase